MSAAELEKTIEAAFEKRDGIGPSTKGAVREAVEAALDLLDKRRGARRRKVQPTVPGSVNQWLKKAVLLSFRLNDMSVIAGGPAHAAWWDKVPSKFDDWDDKNFRAAGFRAVPGCDRAPLRLYRAGRGADALVRQPRRLCGFRHHDRHLGDGRLLRADRQELPYLRRRRHRRRARAAAGRPGHRRGQLLHRRALGSGRRRDRARRRGAVDGRVHRRLDQDRRPRDRRR